jgi:serine/threonine protein kinase
MSSYAYMAPEQTGRMNRSIDTRSDLYAVGVLLYQMLTGCLPFAASEHLDRVFEAFYTTKSSGTGMGLSICRSIIHAHGGKLWAEANEPRGAVFQFTLPAAGRELTNPLQARERI